MDEDRFFKLFQMNITELEAERRVVQERIHDKWNATDSQYIEDIDTYTGALIGLRAKWSAEARDEQRKAEHPHLRVVS